VKLIVSIWDTVSSFSSGAVEWYTLQENFYIKRKNINKCVDENYGIAR
jgi:hypothetical protein